jgi:ABC-type transporter Mla subunit MlaD
MNTLQNVYDRLSDKTELAKHEVQLGVVEDIAKALDNAKVILKALIADKPILANADKAIAVAIANADKLVQTSEKNVEKASAFLPKIGTILDKADVAAKGLGLDSKGITGYAELDKIYFAIEKAEKEVGLYYKFQN